MRTVFLSDVCDLVAGFAFKSKDFGNFPDKVIKITNINPPYVDTSNLAGVDVSKYDVKKLKKFETIPGDYVLAMTGATIGKMGRLEKGRAYVNQRVLLFRPIEEVVNKNFLFYVLSHPFFNKYIFNHLDSETAQPNISATTVGKYEFDLPNLEIQNKIANILTSLDNKISLNIAINNNVEQQAQALIADYVSKTPGVTSLGALLSFVNGFAFKSGDYLAKGLYKIITIKNVQDGLVDSQGAACMDDLPAKLPSDCKLNIGDVLLSLTGNVGRVGIVTENNLLLNQRVAKVKSKNNDLLPFIYFVLRLPAMKTEMENISKGTAQQNLSPIETLKLQLSFDESTAVDLSHTLSSMFNQIVHNMIQNRNLSEIRDALMPKLMSGEIDVSKVDVSDPGCLDKSLFNYVEG